ncbi:hypothetical protein C8R47DRAFT_1217138 [Mycena vitilis]|nr:hypothetical protein C8R47DRAFT_1217138 [Mycena vitilis]
MARPGPKTKFSSEQEAHITSFYPELWKEYKKSSVSLVTSWKTKKIKDIMASPLFVGKLDTGPEGAPEKEWRRRILKKFNNFITKKKKASPTEQSSFLQFTVTGFGLFGLLESAAIKAAATAHASRTLTRLLDCIESCQQEMWDALSAEQQAEYERRAQETDPTVATNQADFPRAMDKVLNDLCQGGAVGNMELMLFWAHREVDGELRYGVVDAHSADHNRHMADETEDWEDSFDDKWMRFAEKAIPRPLSEVNPGGIVKIPRNSLDIPVFPSLDLRKYNHEAIFEILKDYLTQLWEHEHRAHINPPWTDKSESRGQYYNTSLFALPFDLKTLDSLSIAEVFGLTEYFLKTATIDSDKPFVFEPIPASNDLGGSQGTIKTKKRSEPEGTSQNQEDQVLRPNSGGGRASPSLDSVAPESDPEGSQGSGNRKRQKINDGSSGSKAVCTVRDGVTGLRVFFHGKLEFPARARGAGGRFLRWVTSAGGEWVSRAEDERGGRAGFLRWTMSVGGSREASGRTMKGNSKPRNKNPSDNIDGFGLWMNSTNWLNRVYRSGASHSPLVSARSTGPQSASGSGSAVL